MHFFETRSLYIALAAQRFTTEGYTLKPYCQSKNVTEIENNPGRLLFCRSGEQRVSFISIVPT